MAIKNLNKSKKVKEAETSLPATAGAAPVLGTDKKIEKKFWHIQDRNNGYTLEFYPEFVVQDETSEHPGEVECRNLWIVFTDPTTGRRHEMIFDWMNIYMFIYYTANEELRQQLATRYERKVNYIPYDLTISISPEEAKAGTAKRRVELPVDELTMAIARDEAWKIWMKNKSNWGNPSHFLYKNKK